jgi:hypothetical protein
MTAGPQGRERPDWSALAEMFDALAICGDDSHPKEDALAGDACRVRARLEDREALTTVIKDAQWVHNSIGYALASPGEIARAVYRYLTGKETA